ASRYVLILSPGVAGSSGLTTCDLTRCPLVGISSHVPNRLAVTKLQGTPLGVTRISGAKIAIGITNTGTKESCWYRVTMSSKYISATDSSSAPVTRNIYSIMCYSQPLSLANQ